jgi:quercetin dioxygenase-like cupin family protein
LKVCNYHEVEGKEEIPGVVKRVVAGPDEGADNFVMRVFELQPNSSTPLHSHNWEHEIFVLAGYGAIKGGDGDATLLQGDVVFVPANEAHCLYNTGEEIFRFICVIPMVGHR